MRIITFMTGREKILITINLIDHYYQQSLSGNTVKFDSNDLDNAGIRLEEQNNILDALKEDYECIEYSYTKPYSDLTDDDNLPSTLVQHLHMKSGAVDVKYYYLDYKIRSQKDFIITILDKFDEVKNKAKADDLEKYQYHTTALSDKPLGTPIVDKNSSEIIYVAFRNNVLIIGLRPGMSVPLGKPLRYDSPPYNFMQYILKNPNRPISVHEIQEKVEGCKTKTDLSELVRNCHFNKELKRIFFERTTQKTIRFTPWRELNGEQLEWFINWIETTREQIATNREE